MEFPVSINPSQSLAPLGGVCYFLGSVLSQQKFEATEGPVLQLHVTTQFCLESKGKYILQLWGMPTQKTQREERPPGPILAPLFMFFSPPPEPALRKLV